jgi:hypothetical protein
VKRLRVTFKDHWTGKHGLEVSDGEFRFVLVGFGEGFRWRLRKPKGWRGWTT